MRTLLLIAPLAVAALIANRRRELLELAGGATSVELEGADGYGPSAEQGQGGALFDAESFLSTFDPLTYRPTMIDDDTEAQNLAAFLLMIRRAEGTAGDNGYRTVFGGSLFASFADHPRRAVAFMDARRRRLYSTAAGAYQFMAVSLTPAGTFTKVDTWDRLQRKLELPDFGPASQDAAAVELIREAGALNDVKAGRLVEAIGKVRRIWASLPGAGYDQPERSIGDLAAYYTNAGGTLA